MRYTLAFLLLPLLLFQPALAQQQGYWLRLYVRTQLGPRCTLHSEVDERRRALPDQQWQLITHQHLHYRVSPVWDGAAGASYSWQPQGGVLVPERRTFEEVSASFPLSARFRLQPRLRVEQRWQQRAGSTDEEPAWVFRARYRSRLQLECRLSEAWKLRASNELMLHGLAFDQNRLYAGAERRLGAGFALELGYLHLWQKATGAGSLLQRDVLRLTLFKDLSLLPAS
ncbi:hypothetical protein GCM10023185_31920 [Hymenobacter saemangeumensis]|uniref:DUF2490 domain-containing protein n=1 Tax=Hymenobacter saemangeumensis TaxID=1084522 RepID=A0ABP8IME5_9BACT